MSKLAHRPPHGDLTKIAAALAAAAAIRAIAYTSDQYVANCRAQAQLVVVEQSEARRDIEVAKACEQVLSEASAVQLKTVQWQAHCEALSRSFARHDAAGELCDDRDDAAGVLGLAALDANKIQQLLRDIEARG